jgi:hypothetical protein
MGIFVGIPVILIILGAVFWPKTCEETLQAYDLLPGVVKQKHKRKSLIYFMAYCSVQLNHVIFRKKWQREKEARQQKIESNRNAKSWKCLTCGKVNLGVQEMCACGQRRDDETNDRDFS